VSTEGLMGGWEFGWLHWPQCMYEIRNSKGIVERVALDLH
jgi:hypothetical protein